MTSPKGRLTFEDIKRLLEPKPVFLPLKYKKKYPAFPRWQKTTWDETQTIEYQSELDKHHNIGVLFGKASRNLIAIDCDAPEFLEGVSREIPELRNTFTVVGNRGAKLFVRIIGKCPQSAKTKGLEILSDGTQGVVMGIHPLSTSETPIVYKVTNPVPPIAIPLERLLEGIATLDPGLARRATPGLPESPESDRESAEDVRELEAPPEAPAAIPGPAVEALERDRYGNPPGYVERIETGNSDEDNDPPETASNGQSLGSATEPTESTEFSERTDVVGIGETRECGVIPGGVSKLVESWRPRMNHTKIKPKRGSNDRNIFNLNRLCLDFEIEIGRLLSPGERSDAFKAWIQLAPSELKPDEDRQGIYWEKFCAGRKNAKTPFSAEPLVAAENEAAKLVASRGSNGLDAAIAPWAFDLSVKSPQGYGILALCYTLQKAALSGSLKQVFFLSTRKAAKFIGSDDPMIASRKFNHFVEIGIPTTGSMHRLLFINILR